MGGMPKPYRNAVRIGPHGAPGLVLRPRAGAIVPGAVKEGKRAVWQVGQVQVYDGGADGAVTTSPNTLFARQGVFVP